MLTLTFPFFLSFLQIGFSGSSPLLSSKSLYPLYFRTNPSETFANLGRIAILRRFNWKRVAILQQNNDVFTGISNSLVELLEAANFSVIAYESFKDHPGFAIENLKVQKCIIGFKYVFRLYHSSSKITMKMISLKARAQMRHFWEKEKTKPKNIFFTFSFGICLIEWKIPIEQRRSLVNYFI